MKRFLPVFFVLAIFTVTAAAQASDSRERQGPPPDFTGDECTFFPDGNYGDCCYEHDKDYFRGGSAKERRASDKRLYRCVKAKKGWRNKFIAPVMYLGVRILGTSFLPTRFRWGFGQIKPKKVKSEKSEKANTVSKEATLKREL